MEASALRRQRTAALPRSRRLLGALGDDRLVEQVRRGNEAAFEVVYDRHYRGILAFCRHMLGSREEAEDAVQQTFTSAFTDLQSNDRDIRLKAWLYTIARNRCLSILRGRREQAAELDDVPTAGLSEQVQQRADLQELLHDLRELPHDQREALVLFEIGDLSQAEVADVIGVEPVKVKALVFQARSSLIENREARAIPCSEIREQLATASGGALRRGPLRRHIKACEGCREYRDQVRDQRHALALVLPVIPTAGLKESVLAAIGFGGGAGGGGVAAGSGAAAGVGAAGGSGATGGGVFAAVGGMGAAKLAVGAALGVGAIAGGGVAIERTVDDGGGIPSAEAAEAARDNGAAGGGGDAQGAAAPGTPVSNGGGAGGGASGDDAKSRDRDDRKSDDGDRKSDDNKGDDRRSDGGKGAGPSGDRGTSNRRGSRGRGSARGQRSGRRIGRRLGGNGRKGERGRRQPQGPRPGTGRGSGNSGNGGGNTGTAPTPPVTPVTPETEGQKGTRPAPVAPSTTAPAPDEKLGAERALPADLPVPR